MTSLKYLKYPLWRRDIVFRIRSASAIGRIAPGGDHQRHMVVRLGVGDGKADRHHVEERRIGDGDRMLAEIGADMEGEFEFRRARAESGAISGASVRPLALVTAVAMRVRASPLSSKSSTLTPSAGWPRAVSSTCVVRPAMQDPHC